MGGLGHFVYLRGGGLGNKEGGAFEGDTPMHTMLGLGKLKLGK